MTSAIDEREAFAEDDHESVRSPSADVTHEMTDKVCVCVCSDISGSTLP